MMIFGEFDIEVFYTSPSLIMFVVYTFIVVIVMLNVLIAIVGDSYDKSMLHGTRLFGRARVLLVAELFAFERGLQQGTFSSPMLFGDSWGKCFSASFLIAIWGFLLSSLYLQAGGFHTNDLVVAESSTLSVRRHFEDTQRRSDHGAYALQSPQFQACCAWFALCLTRISIRSGISIGIGFGAFFLSLLLLMLPWLQLDVCFPVQALNRFLLQPLNRFLLQPITRFLQSILLRFFGLLLGRSTSDEFSVGENVSGKTWMGRIHHLETNVADTVDGSEDRVKASFHKAVEDSENSVKANVNSRLATIEASAKASADSLQASVDSLQASVDFLQSSVAALETKVDVSLKEILFLLKWRKSE
jgi:hypothetical protein